MEYNQADYSQLPGLFNIEAVVSPDRNNVTLFVNGTNCSNNVTAMCRHLRNAILGQTETLFTLVLEFICKFSHLDCIMIIVSTVKISGTLPPPNNVRQGPGGRLQMMWQPPTLFTPQNVSVDSRITHVISIISEDTMIISIETISRDLIQPQAE